MRQLPPVTGTANRTIDDRENWVAAGLLVALLGPALLALVAVPDVVLGATVGVAALELGKRLYCRAVRLVARQRTSEQSGCKQQPQIALGN